MILHSFFPQGSGDYQFTFCPYESTSFRYFIKYVFFHIVPLKDILKPSSPFDGGVHPFDGLLWLSENQFSHL